jgi:uroporphyrinogen-III synthase
MREIGLKPNIIAAAPTTDGVIATLKLESLSGKTVSVQLYSESNPPLTDFLTQAGAIVRTVQPYIYAPATDAERVAELITSAAAGRIDAIVFTSSPQVDRLYEVATERKLEDEWKLALDHMKVASVGPIVSNTLRAKGARVDIQPEQGFQMKNLVIHIRRSLGGA